MSWYSLTKHTVQVDNTCFAGWKGLLNCQLSWLLESKRKKPNFCVLAAVMWGFVAPQNDFGFLQAPTHCLVKEGSVWGLIYKQRLADSDLWAKSGMSPVFIHKVLLEHNTLIRLHTGYGCFCVIRTPLNSWKRSHMKQKTFANPGYGVTIPQRSCLTRSCAGSKSVPPNYFLHYFHCDFKYWKSGLGTRDSSVTLRNWNRK